VPLPLLAPGSVQSLSSNLKPATKNPHYTPLNNHNNSRRRYQAALASAARSTHPAKLLQQICPHLDKRQIGRIARNARRQSLYTFAVPATFVGDSVSSFMTLTPKVPGDFSLLGPCTHRVKSAQHLPFAQEALAYSRRQWSEGLIARNWKDVLVFRLLESGCGNNAPPVMTLTCAISRDYNSVLNDHRAGPASQLIDDCIVAVTADCAEAQELGVGFTHLYCSECGGGLRYGGWCEGCSASYMNIAVHLGVDNQTPLPKRVSDAAIAAGWLPKLDPELARTKERLQWEAAERGRTARFC